MIKYIYILFLISIPVNAQLGLFKYSTWYIGTGVNSTINEANTYVIQDGILTETTRDLKYDYRISLGVRRLARLNFEQKGKSYIDGSETTWGKYRSSLLKGLEYLISYEDIRDRGIKYKNSDIWFRYLGSFYQAKLQTTNLQGLDLKYRSVDLRLKYNYKDFQITVGGIYRFHPAYGVNPFSVFSGSDYVDVAQDLGYSYSFYWNDLNNNGYVDRTESSFNYWMNPLGDTIADSNSEFMQYHYSDIINSYNNREIEKLGIQRTLSAVIGVSYYNSTETYSTLIWFDVLPVHKKITEFGYNNKTDYELGLLLQKRITKTLSFYTEVVYLSYLGRENFGVKSGINILIK